MFKYLKSNKQKGNIVNFSWVIVRFLVVIIHHILSFPFIHIYLLKTFLIVVIWDVINSDHCIYSHIHIAFDSLVLTHFILKEQNEYLSHIRIKYIMIKIVFYRIICVLYDTVILISKSFQIIYRNQHYSSSNLVYYETRPFGHK